MAVRRGPVTLVTGANKGIGKEIAKGLAIRGMTTLLGCRDPLRGELAARELGSAGTVVPVCLTSSARCGDTVGLSNFTGWQRDPGAADYPYGPFGTNQRTRSIESGRAPL